MILILWLAPILVTFCNISINYTTGDAKIIMHVRFNRRNNSSQFLNRFVHLIVF
jgi:hypothetical protein